MPIGRTIYRRIRADGIRAAAIVLALTLAAGCAGGKPARSPEGAAPKPVTLEYWTPFSGGDNLFMTELVEAFNKSHTDIRIEQINSRLDDYYSRLRTAVLAGNAPDLAVIHATNLPQFVQNGYIERLDAPASGVGLNWEMFNPRIVKSTLYNGWHYAVPLDTHTLVLYYNKALLREAGLLDASEKPVIAPGEAGFIAFLQELQASLPDRIAPLALPSTRIDSVWFWWSLYNQMDGGGVFYDDTGKRAAFDNPQSLRALEFVDSLYRKELIPPGINDSFTLFHDGQAALLLAGVWGTGAFEKAPGLELGAVPVPVIYDHPAAWGDSHTLAIPAGSAMTDEKRRAALIFADWVAEHGVMWAAAGHVPSVKTVLDSPEFKAMKFRSDYAAAADSVAYWPRNIIQWSLNEEMIRQFERMIYRQQTPEETLDRAAAAIDRQLAQQEGTE
ncbi:ABC transporter substrate-binding protein [Paenibacillus spiritus]|uniref:ABC transporter substrate-binding protein n=1 Tax=Paenibacillus spiritus TaxID=2496557 RepID=A0A5J5G8E7_9BACL|nr:ABC transporter substrate-binding protein [Paenibacillus spiritus]KAA9003977.1 ABC transporter substrate-binding protein [Paenibacillus spiritus]